MNHPLRCQADQMTSSRLRVCDRELDRDRPQSLPLSAENSDPLGVMNWNVPPEARKNDSRSRVNWNPWILTCILVISVVMLVLIEAHLHRLTIHPPFV